MSVSRHDMRAVAARRGRLGAAGFVVAVALSGCANQAVQQHYAHGHEYFSEKKYGHASPKVIADGQPVPKGAASTSSGIPIASPAAPMCPRKCRPIPPWAWPPGTGRPFTAVGPPTAKSTTWRSITAAHPTMPLPSYARVTNLANGYSVIVRVNDRGPYHGGRVMDVSSRTADVLDFKGAGTARIKVEYVGRAPMEGSDDTALLASLRTDGSPAHMDGYGEATMVADNRSAPEPSLFAGLFGFGGEPPAPPPQAPAPPAAIAPPAREAVQVAGADRRRPWRLPGRRPLSRCVSRTGRRRCRRRVRSTSGKRAGRPGWPMRPRRSRHERPPSFCRRVGLNCMPAPKRLSTSPTLRRTG